MYAFTFCMRFSCTLFSFSFYFSFCSFLFSVFLFRVPTFWKYRHFGIHTWLYQRNALERNTHLCAYSGGNHSEGRKYRLFNAKEAFLKTWAEEKRRRIRTKEQIDSWVIQSLWCNCSFLLNFFILSYFRLIQK